MTSTPAGSGDEIGADGELKFKAAKGKKKLTRKEMKAREDRRRARTRKSHFYLRSRSYRADTNNHFFARIVAFLSSTIPGATREPDTESEDETLQGKALRIPSKKKQSASTPQLAGMR
jgi:elongation factor 3